jgi:tetratricopeptide (TPR) repeat protein
MKNLMLTITLLLAVIIVNAQNSAYQKAMQKAFAEMEAADSAEEIQAVANTFERISQKAEGEYLPHYYAALSLLNYNWYLQNPTERDKVIDQALEHVKKAQELAPQDDEVEVLHGYGLMAKMTVDPMNRGQSYSPRVYQSYGKALAMNPQNPRAMTMMAQMELGTAQHFGTEPTKACELANQSIPLFEAETKTDDFQPTWGIDMAREILANCN